jgi:hypothetical protein
MTSGEKRSIVQMLLTVAAHGWHAVYVFDGEERQRGAGAEMTFAEVIEACDSVDDSHIHFHRVNGATTHKAWVRIILGNASDGSEVCADHSVSPGFAQAMDTYYTQHCGC